MSTSFTPLRSILPLKLFSQTHHAARTTGWWGPIWRGLFVDPTGKHYHAMGKALWLYGYLIVHADRKTGVLYRRIATISNDMQVSGRTVQAWLSLLRRHGYIRTKTTGRTLEISIEKWKPIHSKRQNSFSVGAPFRSVPPAAFPPSH